jgi:MarR family transcriptional repressor of emrRAB
VTSIPPCPTFAIVEANIARVAKRLGGAPVRDVVLLRLIKHLSAGFSLHLGRLVRPSGLNEVGFRTLMMLYANAKDGVFASQLSEATGETRTNMTRICDELVRKGLLRRHAGTADRRRVVLAITARGIALVERLLPDMWSQLDRGLRGISAKDKRDLERLLKKLVAALEAWELPA